MPKVAAAKTALDQATAGLTAGQTDVAKWQSEIVFAAKLTAFRAKQVEVDQVVTAFEQVNAELTKMQQDVAAATAEVAKTQQVEVAATAAATEGKQKLAAVVALNDALAKQVATTEAALPMIKDAGDKAVIAAAAMPTDKDLAAAVEQLKLAFDRNTKMVADGKAQLAVYATEMAAMTVAVAALDAKVVEAKTLVAKANETVVAKQAAMKPVAEKMAVAKQTADQARAGLGQLQQEVDAMRQQASTEPTPKPVAG